jgi:hypothetical protein
MFILFMTSRALLIDANIRRFFFSVSIYFTFRIIPVNKGSPFQGFFPPNLEQSLLPTGVRVEHKSRQGIVYACGKI